MRDTTEISITTMQRSTPPLREFSAGSPAAPLGRNCQKTATQRALSRASCQGSPMHPRCELSVRERAFASGRRLRCIIGALLLLPGSAAIGQTDEAVKIPDVQLDSLVAPV